MKLQPRGIERFLREPGADIRAILLYGPDGGLVRERAEQLARTVVDDLSDAFRVAEITPASLREEPSRLADEAASLSLTGGRRVVRLRGATDVTAAAVEDFLAGGAGEALVIVEAADLPARSRLRKIFEDAEDAAAVPCYYDEGRALDDVIVDTLARHGMTVASDALSFLRANLGGDRGVSRSELEKLALYVGEPGEVSLDDAMQCVGDSALMTLDDIAFATAGGDQSTLSRGLARAEQEGASPVTVLRAVSRHFQRLQLAAARIAGGDTAERAMRALRPPVFFKQTEAFREQLRHWKTGDLSAALAALTDAEIACKSTGVPAEAACGRALMRLAFRAGALRRRG